MKYCYNCKKDTVQITAPGSSKPDDCCAYCGRFYEDSQSIATAAKQIEAANAQIKIAELLADIKLQNADIIRRLSAIERKADPEEKRRKEFEDFGRRSR